MPIRITTLMDVAVPARGRRSQVVQMAEYKEAMMKIPHMKTEEVIEVSFPVSTKPGMKTILQTFKRTLNAELKKLHLTDFEVRAFRLGDTNYITIAHVPPLTGLKQVPAKRRAV